MTKEQLEKYKNWTEWVVKGMLVLCVSACVTLFTDRITAQNIHHSQNEDIKELKKDVKKVVVIPESIKLNAWKINQCNKSIDEVKKDLNDFKIQQNKKMDKIIDLLIQIKRNE